MRISSHSEHDSPVTDMTPLVDTVLNLLVFFLVAGSFAQAEREIKIALPAASAAQPISATLREIIVNVTADGKIILDGNERTPQVFGDIVKDAVAANPEQKVTVRGDRASPYDNIVRVLDICKVAGIQEPYLDTVVIN
jgi:biopolymer transport protein ExbD